MGGGQQRLLFQTARSHHKKGLSGPSQQQSRLLQPRNRPEEEPPWHGQQVALAKGEREAEPELLPSLWECAVMWQVGRKAMAAQRGRWPGGEEPARIRTEGCVWENQLPGHWNRGFSSQQPWQRS